MKYFIYQHSNFLLGQENEGISEVSSEQLTLAHGNADVTRVRNVLFSHFKISQQFFRLLTEESLELSADSDLACRVKLEGGKKKFNLSFGCVLYEEREKINFMITFDKIIAQ
jgi:hypothetical protein